MQPKPPTKPTLDGLERKWAERWARSGVYRFDRSKSRVEVFSIDTPPPTVSGSLHLGHAFSYTQTDVIARFQRMRGRAVFYPMGWDDNGLPTERRVQRHFGVRCDPSLPYKPAFEPPEWPSKQPIAVSRPNFVELCSQLTMQDEQAFEALFRRLGLSVGRSMRSPLFGARVPLLTHRLADPGKGTGVAMLCTFGDPTDLVWWRELGLGMRPVLDRDGTIRTVRWGTEGFDAEDPMAAQRAHDELAGLPVAKARERVAAMLRRAGALTAPPARVTQTVKFYEHGSQPVEILTSRQWFVRTLSLKAALLARGAELSWHPAFMRSRFQTWVNGLASDWCISRQRFFGVPFPLWFPVGPDGAVDHDHPLVPEEPRLPIDPSTDVPVGYTADQRGRPGGFVGAPDVMDTWATSALTPEIAGGWEDDPDLFARVFPMDLRPQGHDIIRTWPFYSVARAHVEHDTLPWAHAMISGWVVDPNRRKMAKSRGNVLTPDDALERCGADALRWWAAGKRAGADTAFDEGQLRVGRRLATKLLHASRFVLAIRGDPAAEIGEPLDRAMLAALAAVVDEA